jgi:hypothetical protein
VSMYTISNNTNYLDCCLMDSDALEICRCLPTFWKILTTSNLLRNADDHLQDYMASQPRRPQTIFLPQWKLSIFTTHFAIMKDHHQIPVFKLWTCGLSLHESTQVIFSVTERLLSQRISSDGVGT